jgi:hypothetical protein
MKKIKNFTMKALTYIPFISFLIAIAIATHADKVLAEGKTNGR